MEYDIQDDTGDDEEKKVNLEAGEGGWMKNTSQQEICHGSQSDTWK